MGIKIEKLQIILDQKLIKMKINLVKTITLE